MKELLRLILAVMLMGTLSACGGGGDAASIAPVAVSGWAAANVGMEGGGNVYSYSLAIDPTNSQVVYAGTSSGIFKSTNGGSSWTAVNTGLTNTSVRCLVIDPTNSQVVYAGTGDGGIFKTVTGGV